MVRTIPKKINFKFQKKTAWLKYCTVPNKHVDGSQEYGKFQFELQLQLNQIEEFYFQQHLFTSLVAEYKYTKEGTDYDTVERASIADGAG